jgi:hypothetical protein
MTIKIQTILCSTPLQPLSLASYLNLGIRLMTNSKFDHALGLVKLDDEYCVINCTNKGVSLEHLKVYLEHTKKRKRTHFLVIDEEGFDTKIPPATFGLKYDFGTFWRIPLFLFAKRFFGNKSKITQKLSFIDNENAWYCFEYAAETRKMPNSHLITGYDFEKTTSTCEIDLEALLDK